MKQGVLKSVAGTLIALSILGGSSAFAQGRDRDRATDEDRTTDRGRIQDRDQDRIADRDRLLDRDQDRLADRDRDRERDELHVQDRDQLRDRDIYGSELMTRQERREYQNRIREMETVQEWARYRAEHQAQIMARAREQGVDLPAPFYGQQLMTDQEREQLRERLRDAASDQERERIRAEHREQMQDRARLHQIPLSELD
jgi:hypothetical protein